MSHRRDLDKFIDETRSSQRNIVFPDTVRNGRSVDVFFWRGSPAPTLVQRIAAWMFGLAFTVGGLMFLPLAAKIRNEGGSWASWELYVVLACFNIVVGTRFFRNGFARKATAKSKDSN